MVKNRPVFAPADGTLKSVLTLPTVYIDDFLFLNNEAKLCCYVFIQGLF